jgi:MFS family permease
MSTSSDEQLTSQQVETPAQPAGSHPTSLWRNRDYLLLWSGQIISSVGTQVSGLAFPLLALLLTASPAQAGFMGALRAVPYLFLSLPVGALVDRWDRKRVMILCDSGRALTLGSIPLVYILYGTVPVAQLYLAALIEGTLFVFFNIAEVACLPRVVPKEQLAAATGQNQAVEGTASLIGPPLSGILYAASHLLPFLADAISYVFSVISLSLIRTSFQGERTAERRKLRVEISEGLLWLWRQPLIRFLAFITGGLDLTGSGFGLIIIVLAQQQGANAPVIGLIFTIGSIGIIIGSLIGAPVQKRFRFGPVVIATMWIQTLVFPLFAIAPTPLLLGVVSAAFFVVFPVFNVTVLSYRLALIPDALQGRVNSVVRMIAFGTIPLGQALTGVSLQYLGGVGTVLICAAGTLVLAILTTLDTHVRHARPIEDLKAV